MKLVIRTVLFHFLVIIVFAYIYFGIANEFESSIYKHVQKYNSFIDYLLLSTTIQAGIGMSDLFPITIYGKTIMIIQQFIVLLTHVITLYVFTL